MTVEERVRQYEEVTGTDGRFLFCRVPAGPNVVVEAIAAQGTAQPQTFVLEEAGQGMFVTVHIPE